ncbi:TPA: nicotinate phosphoribosyltransferase [Xanthomonas vasicola pv. zeae]|uniref:Nicotinate phosphoribosyltransferase n=2 Tax=Xanthomonas vasicola pv. vasculorum TaxID=325776 RepID=A0A836ZVZ3_XANVA|nr:nicotinate phosphoribosyltransferase [Xanthomonas vasicola]AVQ05923.1 nicotinate phosphoribosyltransferase [Xanthomonas vasicola pv. vasculorum]AZM70123.1 nicotinate phosphoribosyltransferase [Xanthomonas vasicola pv. vasculorum]AZR27950.1 nicotinate phosphoribosyltransferase [Xanthomonas vasicola pv. arecae]KEZ97725.1 nicotinate phosphoribosyltransferase [Xanthomonas vasicola pv. vasculorum NCPPB 895]KFA30820.1 nicotinate phosphoribosyltransferase [Xanthomonas vasicola pv. vasculorum NCPPB
MIIHSLLDTDLYKFTMMQAVLHQHPAAQVDYRFTCRTPGVDLAQFIDEISRQIDALCRLRLREDEVDYLRSLRFIKPDFADFLALFHLDRKYLSLTASATHPGEIELTIRGPWLHTILFEVPLLAIINEVWFRNTSEPDFEEGRSRLREKVSSLRSMPAGCKIADYGTRRRYSRQWHGQLLPLLRDGLGEQFVGTSNVYFAKQYGLTPLGTMAHEYLQAFQALGPRLRDSQVAALESWAREYRGDLGIALSDVVGLDAFLRDFDLYFCKLFDGMRHDSGDPFEWGERVIAHLEAHRIDPRTKVLVFSDGLNIDKVMRLYAHFHTRCRLAFGVGTSLTNDLGPTPLQIVIKMVRCNGQPVAKLSDSPGKSMCEDIGYLRYLRDVFGLPPMAEA